MRPQRGQSSIPAQCVLIAVMAAFLGAPNQTASGQNRETALINRLEQQMLDEEISRRLSDHRGQTMGEKLTLDYGASLRLGWAKLDNANAQPYGLRQYEANTYLQASWGGGHRVFGNLRFLYNQYYNSTNSNNGWLDPIGNRYWYEFDLKEWQQANEGSTGDIGFNIRAGRQFVTWNSGLVFSNDIYGAKMRLDWEQLTIEGLIGVSARSGLYDFDVSRPNYDSETDRQFYGVRAELDLTPEFKPFVSYFIQDDHNDNNQALPFFGNIDFEYDSQYLSFGTNGSIGNQFLYTFEAVWESGHGTTTPLVTPAGVSQQQENIDAWAAIFNAVYLLRDHQQTRIEGTIGFGTGDGDRRASSSTFGGNWPGSPDRAFNSLGYINTGLALAPSMTNLMMLRLGASTAVPYSEQRPDAMRIGADFFVFGKTTKNAPISAPTVRGQRYVGFEVDLNAQWRITSDVSFNLRYGLFVPNRGNPQRIGQIRQFLYGGISYAF